MNENFVLGIIATVVTILLLAMPFMLFKKKKDRKPKPHLLTPPHDDTEIVTTEEQIKTMHIVLEYLLMEDVINDEDRQMVKANMQKWKTGVKFRNLIDLFFADLQKSTSIKWPLIRDVVMNILSSVEILKQKKDVETQAIVNTAICRICYNRVLHNLKAIEF